MSRNNDYTTANFHQSYYKLIGTDSSRQTKRTIPLQIDFTGKLEGDNSATMFFITGKQQKIILTFSLDSLFVTK